MEPPMKIEERGWCRLKNVDYDGFYRVYLDDEDGILGDEPDLFPVVLLDAATHEEREAELARLRDRCAKAEKVLWLYVENDECEYFGLLPSDEACTVAGCLRCEAVWALNPDKTIGIEGDTK